MKNRERIIKTLIYLSVGGLIGFTIAYTDVSIVVLSLIFILQVSIMVVLHEFMHGFCAERNGLMFTAMYVGPFMFKRENGWFRSPKKIKMQWTYLGRAVIENREIRDDIEFIRHNKAWKRSVLAGPQTDFIISIICIFIGIYTKSISLIISTLIIDIVMCLPSFIYGDGHHYKMMKKDIIFAISIMYTSIISSDLYYSESTYNYLEERLLNEMNSVYRKNYDIVSLAIASQLILYKYIIENRKIPPVVHEIITDIRDGDNNRFSNGMDIIYYKSIIHTAIVYYTCIEDDFKWAQILYRGVSFMKPKLPGEYLDKIRSQHVLGIKDRTEEIISKKNRNPVFDGCEGISKKEEIFDGIVIDYAKKMKFYTS